MSADVVDSTAVEVPSRELARVTHEVLLPLDIGEQKAAMDLYQRGLASILDASDWQDAGRGEKFVKKSGWRKIATWYSLSIELVRDSVDRAPDGSVARAQVWARAIAPNGRYSDGDGYCDVSESRFARNKAKLENDLRGTATTRAVNRAISNLVGMGAVSHEEMVATDSGPPFGPPANEAQLGQLRRAVAYVTECEDSSPTVCRVLDGVTAKASGYIPVIAMQAVGLLAAAVKDLRDVPWEDPPAIDADPATVPTTP